DLERGCVGPSARVAADDVGEGGDGHGVPPGDVGLCDGRHETTGRRAGTPPAARAPDLACQPDAATMGLGSSSSSRPGAAAPSRARVVAWTVVRSGASGRSNVRPSATTISGAAYANTSVSD